MLYHSSYSGLYTYLSALPQRLQLFINVPECFTTAVAVVWLLVLVVYLQMNEVHAVVFKRLVALLALVQYRIWVSNNAVNAAAVVNVVDVVATATGAVAVTIVCVAVVFSLAVVAAVVVAVDGVKVPAMVVTTDGPVAVTGIYFAVTFSLAIVAAVIVTVAVDVFMVICVHTSAATVAFTIITVSRSLCSFLLLHSPLSCSIFKYFLWMEAPDMSNTRVPLSE